VKRSLPWRFSDRLLALVFDRKRSRRRIADSGLFDEAWYVANNPDAAGFEGGPLAHYMRKGAGALRDPNPFFDAAWYCAARPRARWNPLLHYLKVGAAEGLKPSPAFDPSWYRKIYPDTAGVEPLAHFLRHGRHDGRLPKAPDDFRPVEEAELVCLKPPAAREEMALFVTYAPAGRIKPHVPFFLAALASQGVATTLVVAADDPRTVSAESLLGVVDGLYIRENQGFDFAAWAHVALKLDLARTRSLLLINDSIIGPLNAERFSAMMGRIRASSAHLVGLTESLQVRRHFQSFFLAAKDEGVAALADFLMEVKAYADKRAVILSYELPMLDRFLEAGLSAEALFPASTHGNATVEDWRALVARGFPFVKVAALRSDEGDWRDVLSAEGYDPRLAEDAVLFVN
jgi:Rhamnan synthesis protein F